MKSFSLWTARLWLVVLLLVGLGGNAQAWTTETFESIGYTNGAVIANGATIGNFKYYNSNGCGTYYEASGDYGSKMVGAYYSEVVATDPITYSFIRSDRSAFSLQSIGIWGDPTHSSEKVIINGFRNGARTKRTIVNPQNTAYATVTFTLNWTNVDSLSISDSASGSGLWAYFDNIVWETYALPTVATGTKSGVTTTTATLAGTVNANNTVTADSIQYGTTTSYGTTVVASPATSTGTATATISAALSGLTPNTTYHYRVKAVNSTGTSTGADSTFTTLAIAPVVTTLAASVGSTGATLNGTVNANGASTTVIFQYGTTTSYGVTVTAAQSPLTGASAAAVNAALSGLIPNTTYHFRANATNSGGTTNGSDLTFTTTALAPTVATGTKSGVTTTAATLAGMVNANNSSTTDSIQYGTTSSYGSIVVASPATTTGTTATAISTALSGLQPGTIYHYRVKAVNPAGTSYGADSTFTTSKLPQTIAFDSLVSQTYGTAFVKLTATASSGLAVSYVNGNTAAVRISNDTAYLLAADTATITASQLGNASYLAATPASWKLTIAKKGLTIIGAVATNRTYDGTTVAAVTGATLSGVVNSDDVSLTLGTATFATKDTGTAKPVTVTGSVLSGTKAGNYTLTEVSGLNANITPKSITVTVAAKTKVYGDADPALTYTPTLLLDTDAFTGSLSRNTGDSVGKYGIIQGTLSAGGNYAITYVGDSLSITKKALTIFGATASNKVYDGATAATVTGATLSGVVGSDDVGLALGVAAFATKDTGTAKPVTVTGSVLSGTKAGNYTLIEATGLTAGITTKPITVTADAKTKVYGSAEPALTWTDTGLVNGDVLTGALSRDTGSVEGTYAITQGTLSASSNYSLIFVPANLIITTPATAIEGANPLHLPKIRDLGLSAVGMLPSRATGFGRAELGLSRASDEAAQSVSVLLPEAGTISVHIFDLLGTPVISWSQAVDAFTLANLDATADGRHVATLSWNLRAANGVAVPAGVYLWKIQVNTVSGQTLETVKKLGVK